jgi:hypothetical protein
MLGKYMGDAIAHGAGTDDGDIFHEAKILESAISDLGFWKYQVP